MSLENQVAVITDQQTAEYLKLEKIKEKHVVKNAVEAGKNLRSLLKNSYLSLILVTERVLEWIKPSIQELMKNGKQAVIVSLTGKKGPKEEANTLKELINKTIEEFKKK